MKSILIFQPPYQFEILSCGFLTAVLAKEKVDFHIGEKMKVRLELICLSVYSNSFVLIFSTQWAVFFIKYLSMWVVVCPFLDFFILGMLMSPEIGYLIGQNLVGPTKFCPIRYILYIYPLYFFIPVCHF